MKGLARKNTEEEVRQLSKTGFEFLQQSADNDISVSRTAIEKFSKLKGVGPATASALLALIRPKTFPYMSDEALLHGTGLTDKPKYTPIEYQKMISHIHDQIQSGNGQPCLKDAEQFEKAVWAYGILKFNDKLNEGEKKIEATNKRKSSEPKEDKIIPSSTKRKRAR